MHMAAYYKGVPFGFKEEAVFRPGRQKEGTSNRIVDINIFVVNAEFFPEAIAQGLYAEPLSCVMPASQIRYAVFTCFMDSTFGYFAGQVDCRSCLYGIG